MNRSLKRFDQFLRPVRFPTMFWSNSNFVEKCVVHWWFVFVQYIEWNKPELDFYHHFVFSNEYILRIAELVTFLKWRFLSWSLKQIFLCQSGNRIDFHAVWHKMAEVAEVKSKEVHVPFQCSVPNCKQSRLTIQSNKDWFSRFSLGQSKRLGCSCAHWHTDQLMYSSMAHLDGTWQGHEKCFIPVSFLTLTIL